MDQDLFPGFPIPVALALAALLLVMLVVVGVLVSLGKPVRLRTHGGAPEPKHLLH